MLTRIAMARWLALADRRVKRTAAGFLLLIWVQLAGPESACVTDSCLGVVINLPGLLLESCCSSVVLCSSSNLIA